MANKKLKTKKDFEHRLMDKGRIPNLACGFIVVIYSFYLSALPYEQMGLIKTVIFCSSIALIAFFTQFIVAPRTNHLITKDLSERIEKLYEDEIEYQSLMGYEKSREKDDFYKRQNIERSRLLKLLTRLPFKIGLEVALCFVVIMIGLTFICIFYLQIEIYALIFIIVSFFSCIFYSYMISFVYTESLCSEYAIEFAKKGLDEESNDLQQVYTLKLNKRILLFIIIPFILVNATQFAFVFKNFNNGTVRQSLHQFIVMIVLNSAIMIYLSIFLYKQSISSFTKINEELENFFKNNSSSEVNLPVDFTNEFSYNLYLVNNILTFLQETIGKTKMASLGILYQTSDLTSMSAEMAEKSEAISSIVEESNQKMTKNVMKQVNEISRNISQVSMAAGITKHNVDDGFNLLTENIKKIREISDANIETISGIKKSSEMIEMVWDCINKIDSIAEKSRVIAYNAEIESSQSDSDGEKFHIIAEEIRRLSDTIKENTQEIKDKIRSIQLSSDNLIITSEGGTQRIREGSEFFTSLEEKFRELQVKTDITAEYAEDIQSIVSSQDTAFMQLSTTLYQINKGFQDFAEATDTIKTSSRTIKFLAEKLNSYKNLR